MEVPAQGLMGSERAEALGSSGSHGEWGRDR